MERNQEEEEEQIAVAREREEPNETTTYLAFGENDDSIRCLRCASDSFRESVNREEDRKRSTKKNIENQSKGCCDE